MRQRVLIALSAADVLHYGTLEWLVGPRDNGGPGNNDGRGLLRTLAGLVREGTITKTDDGGWRLAR